MGFKTGQGQSFVLWVLGVGAEVKMPSQYDYNGVLPRPGKELMLYKLESLWRLYFVYGTVVFFLLLFFFLNSCQLKDDSIFPFIKRGHLFLRKDSILQTRRSPARPSSHT